MAILTTGIGLGWAYCKYFVVHNLKKENKELRKIEITEIITHQGTISARTSEWPIDGAEYFYNIIADESFGGTLTEERFIHHLNTFAKYMTGKQKRDFMNMLKASRSTEEIIKSMKL